MFAGVPGQDAHDGAYSAARYLEHCKIAGIDFTGGASDIYKCSDQIDRKLVYSILRAAGCPGRVITAYEASMENVAAHNTISGG